MLNTSIKLALGLGLLATTALTAHADEQIYSDSDKVCLIYSPESYKSDAKRYHIGTDSFFPPFSSISYDSSIGLEGFDVDMLREIARDQKFAFELCAPRHDDSMQNLLYSGNFEGALGAISYTEERAKTIAFSDPYYETHMAAVALDSNTVDEGHNWLKDKVITYKKDTLSEILVLKHIENCPHEILPFDTSMEAWLAISEGAADVMIEDYPVAVHKIKAQFRPGLVAYSFFNDEQTQTTYHFAMPKTGDMELMRKFNAGLKHIKDNGIYDQLVAKHLEDSVAQKPVDVTDQEPIELQ